MQFLQVGLKISRCHIVDVSSDSTSEFSLDRQGDNFWSATLFMHNQTLTTLTDPFRDGVPVHRVFRTNFCSSFAMVDDFIGKPLLLRNCQ
jgi:hypothetical protein